MTYALVALALIVVYLMVQCHLKDQRIASLEAEATGLAERLWDKAEAERQLLLNRIQAPEVAVAQVIDVQGDAPRQFTNFDDDDDFHAAMQDLEG